MFQGFKCEKRHHFNVISFNLNICFIGNMNEVILCHCLHVCHVFLIYSKYATHNLKKVSKISTVTAEEIPYLLPDSPILV